ncbi:MAG: divalent metal cation transporter, partial [Thermomicrobiaceae bacterium]|nr:divalent metal cation transporter [Thermomicrobiaceae bacterium]
RDRFARGRLARARLAGRVLAATTGYVVAEALDWPGSIEERPGRGNWRFYGVVLGSLALGLLASLAGVPPIRFLFLASVVGGLGAPLLLAMLLVLAGSEEAMGRYRVAGPVAAVGWATVAVVSAASLAYVAALLG